MIDKSWNDMTEEEKLTIINSFPDDLKNFFLRNDIIDFTFSFDDEPPEIKGGIGEKSHYRYLTTGVIEIRVSKFKEAKIDKFKNT